MNELTKALKVANTTLRMVKIIDVIKKSVITFATVMCCVFAFRFFRK